MPDLDYKTFIDFEHSGSQAEDKKVTSDAVTFGAGEGFVIDKIEIFPPFDTHGNLEELMVMISIDNHLINSLRLHSDLFPPYLKNVYNVALPLGDPTSTNPFVNTCLKGNKKIQIVTFGGKGGVTGDYRIKVKGYYVESDEALHRLFGGSVFNPVPANLYDVKRNKAITFSKPVDVTIDNLPNMPSGAPDSGVPYIMPYYTWARNSKATTPNQPYALDIGIENVSNDWESLTWDLNENEAIFIDHIAVKPHANSKAFYFKVGTEEIPDSYFDIRYYSNELPWSTFADPRPLREYKILFHNEKATTYILDNGTSIPAEGILVFIRGLKIKLA